MVQLLCLSCDKLLGIVRKRRRCVGARACLFLFSRTVFFGAMEKGRWKNWFEGRVLGEGKPRKNKLKQNDVRLALKCPNIGPLRLDEAAFALAKGPECEKL